MKEIRFTLPDVLSAAECAELIRRTEARGFAIAPITTAAGFLHAPDVRNNGRVMFDDRALVDALWARVAPEIPDVGRLRPIGLNERLRFYRYRRGEAFRWHYDGRFVRSAQERSELTFMVYLNDGFQGGETEFDDPDGLSAVAPRAGTALVFTHGVRHQGAPVIAGTKYVLRSDVMFATP